MFVRHLFPRESHFVGVDNDDVIAAVDVRSVAGLVLAAQDFRHLRREPPEHCICRVDQVPLFGSGLGIDRDSFVA